MVVVVRRAPMLLVEIVMQQPSSGVVDLQIGVPELWYVSKGARERIWPEVGRSRKVGVLSRLADGGRKGRKRVGERRQPMAAAGLERVGDVSRGETEASRCQQSSGSCRDSGLSGHRPL